MCWEVCCCSVAESWPRLCDPADCSTPGSSAFRCLPEFVQLRVHWVSDQLPDHLILCCPLLLPSVFAKCASLLVEWINPKLISRCWLNSSATFPPRILKLNFIEVQFIWCKSNHLYSGFYFFYPWLCRTLAALQVQLCGAGPLPRVQASRCRGVSCCGAWATERRLSSVAFGLSGFTALRHVGSSWTRDWTHVPFTDRTVLYPCIYTGPPGTVLCISSSSATSETV